MDVELMEEIHMDVMEKMMFWVDAVVKEVDVEDMLEEKSALEHYQEGFFGETRSTQWARGEPAVVYWQSGAKHRGGYAYRLCKVNNGKIWEVTEECFQEGHLNFSGTKSWTYNVRENENENPDQSYKPDGWVEQE